MTQPAQESAVEAANRVYPAATKHGATQRRAFLAGWWQAERAIAPAPPASADLRPELSRFAAVMEERLRANDHKGGWDDCESEWLLGRLREEADELEAELRRSPLDPAAVAREAADVANFSMMLADNAATHPVDAQIALFTSAASHEDDWHHHVNAVQWQDDQP